MGTPLDIVLLTHEFAPFRGGAAVYCGEMARALAEQGHRVEVWTTGRPPAGESPADPFPIHRLTASTSLHPWQLYRWGREIVRRRRDWQEKELYLASVGALIVAMHLRLLGLLEKTPVTITLHGSEIPRFERNPWLRLLARGLFHRACRFSTASRYGRERLPGSAFAAEASRCLVAACALSSHFTRLPIPFPRPDDGHVRILTLARIHPRKGQLDTARALAALPPGVKSRLVYQIAGTGDASYLESVRAVCRAGGIQLDYLGEIPPEQMAAVYAACDIYALTSRTLATSVEGFGMTYLEAGYFEKPVVGHRTGGVVEAVLDGQTGLLVAEGDAEALRGALLRLINDPELRVRLGRAGRTHALSFDWKKSAEILFPPTRQI